MVPFGLLTASLVWMAVRGVEADQATRRGWRRIALALFAWVAAAVLWELSGRKTVSWADPIQMFFYPLVLWGVLGLPTTPLDRHARVRFWLDAGVVVLSGAAGIWYFVVWPTFSYSQPNLLAAVVNNLYPVGDLVLLFAVSVILLRHPVRASRRSMLWLAAGLLFRFAGDNMIWWQTIAGTYAPGGVTDLTWMTAAWLLAAGACVWKRGPRADDQERSSRFAALEAPASLAPYASVALLYAFLLQIIGSAWGARAGGVLVAAMGVTGLVLTRQFLATRDHARLQRENAARESEARFRSLVQQSSDVIAVIDAQGIVQYVSPSVARILSREPQSLVGEPLVSLVFPDEQEHFAVALEKSAGTADATEPVLLRFLQDGGAWRTMETSFTDLRDDPTVTGIVVTARDVTDRASLQAQLLHQAYHDPLTGLANRALFHNRVSHAMTRYARTQERIAVLFLDLDDFKTVNDSLGHAVGDRLLVAVAQRLLNATRGCDTVARLGGDEFAVLLEHAEHAEDAAVVADRIVHALDTPFPVAGTEVRIGASVGIARPEAHDGPDEILRNADVAMYRAKGGGKGRWALFAPEMHAALVDRVELEADLRRALLGAPDKEFHLLFQPIVRLDDASVAGLEALVRWNHPQRGTVHPGAFIPIAEASGLIVGLGSWVLHEACRCAAAWQRARRATDPSAPQPTITVNLSGRQLHDRGLVEDVRTALGSSGLDASSLVLEITESVLMHDTETNLATLHTLKALGVRLAIDDFGTGYSSLSYLQRFPIDILKIDKAFVDGVARGGSDAALARTIVALGKMLELRCVAEGIEDEDQRRHLLSIGCEYGQGFLFSRPVTPEAVSVLVGLPPELAAAG
jgi:diguanylate cyclase (GGDEF)-like protein/PAS domain S-box-containing protein